MIQAGLSACDSQMDFLKKFEIEHDIKYLFEWIESIRSEIKSLSFYFLPASNAKNSEGFKLRIPSNCFKSVKSLSPDTIQSAFAVNAAAKTPSSSGSRQTDSLSGIGSKLFAVVFKISIVSRTSDSG